MEASDQGSVRMVINRNYLETAFGELPIMAIIWAPHLRVEFLTPKRPGPFDGAKGISRQQPVTKRGAVSMEKPWWSASVVGQSAS
jgi:hypothetical protein